MIVKKFLHTTKTNHNRRLFSLIGEFCACEDTRKALGGAISSHPGQVWFVAVEGRTVQAFGSIAIHKAHGLLRHLFSPVDDFGAWESVLRHCIEHARQNRACAVRLTDYLALQPRYAPFGFVPYGSPRGRFSQYLLQLESSHGA